MKIIRIILEKIGLLPEDFHLLPEWSEVLNWLEIYSKETILFVLFALVILKFLGFNGASKYISLTLVIAVFIAMLI